MLIFQIVIAAVIAYLTIFLPCRVKPHCNYIYLGDIVLPDIDTITDCVCGQLMYERRVSSEADRFFNDSVDKAYKRRDILKKYSELDKLIAKEYMIEARYSQLRESNMGFATFLPAILFASDFIYKLGDLLAVGMYLFFVILFAVLFWRFPRLYRWECPPAFNSDYSDKLPSIPHNLTLVSLSKYMDEMYDFVNEPFSENISQMKSAITRSKHYSVAAAFFIGFCLSASIFGKF